MGSRTMAIVLAVTVVLALALRPARAEDPPKSVSLTGYWKLDRDRSDDPKQKAREAMEGMRTGEYSPGEESPAGPGIDIMTPGDPRVHNPSGVPGGGRPGTFEPDPRRAVFSELDQPKELTIAQRSTLVLIQEGDDEGNVRGVHTDGQRRPIPGGGGEMSGSWEDGQLVVETWRDNGVRRTETFELSANGRELTVSVSIMAPRMPSLTVRSVYQITPSPPD